MRKRTYRGSQTKKGRHDRGSCLPFWRGRLKSIFGIDRTVAEESPNRPFDRRRFCAVQAFSPQVKTLAQGEFISPEHFKSKGGAALRAAKPKKKDICKADVFLFGAADGSRTRTPVRTQAPQACQSTNSSTAADKQFSKTALLLYCHRTGLSMVFPAESLTFSAAAGPA